MSLREHQQAEAPVPAYHHNLVWEMRNYWDSAGGKQPPVPPWLAENKGLRCGETISH